MTRRSLLSIPFALAAAETSSRWLAMGVGGDIRDSNWPDADRHVSLGSLLKPFLAVAFLATNREAPVVECRGTADGCWFARGHGRQDIVSALANSCNVYFLELAARVNRAALDSMCLSYGLAVPARNWQGSRLIGLGEGWPQTPLAAARAFGALGRDSQAQSVQAVLAGMAQCARSGTGRSVNWPCYAKTGTVKCSHVRGDHIDGYIAAIYPLGQPRSVILAMRHGATGANAASLVRPLALEHDHAA